MATATTVNKKAKDPKRTGDEPVHAIEDLIQRRLDMAAFTYEAELCLLNAIVEREDELEPGKLELLTSEFRCFAELGLTSIHEICRRLQEHRRICELRTIAGDPLKLANAKKALAAAEKEEFETRGNLTDLTVDADPQDEPALIRQIRRLQERLEQLTCVRKSAVDEVRRLEGLRENLRASAPDWLKSYCAQAVNALQQTNGTYRELRAIKDFLFDVERMVESATPNSLLDEENDTRFNYCRRYFPAGVLSSDSPFSRKVDGKKFAVHVEWLRAEELPRLRAERNRLQAGWDALVAEVEAPLTRWVETGEV